MLLSAVICGLSVAADMSCCGRPRRIYTTASSDSFTNPVTGGRDEEDTHDEEEDNDLNHALSHFTTEPSKSRAPPNLKSSPARSRSASPESKTGKKDVHELQHLPRESSANAQDFVASDYKKQDSDNPSKLSTNAECLRQESLVSQNSDVPSGSRAKRRNSSLTEQDSNDIGEESPKHNPVIPEHSEGEDEDIQDPSSHFLASGYSGNKNEDPNSGSADVEEASTSKDTGGKKKKKKKKGKKKKLANSRIAPTDIMTDGEVNPAFEPESDNNGGGRSPGLNASHGRNNRLPPIEKKLAKNRRASNGQVTGGGSNAGAGAGAGARKEEDKVVRREQRPSTAGNNADNKKTKNNKKSNEQEEETERRIRGNDPEHNASFNYANNYISTSKYNLLTFLPKNLFEQFQRLANAYFLALLILQLIPQVSSLTYITTMIPLAFVLCLSALKDAVDDIFIPQIASLTYITTLVPLFLVLTFTALKDIIDDVMIPQISSLTYITTMVPLVLVLCLTALKDLLDDGMVPQISALNPLTTMIPLCAVLFISAMKDAADDVQRHRSDNQVNNRKSQVLRNGNLMDEVWHKVVVGDIIRMENDQFVAADLLLLSTSEPNSLLYIETAELDGETNLKVKQALPETAQMGENLQDLSNFDGEIVCEPPNNRLPKYDGLMNYGGNTYALDNDKILLRGCVLRNTRWCYGLVVFAGKETKLMMNSGQAMFKRTNIDRLMNVLIIGIFIFLLSVCLICTVCCGIWETLIGNHFQIYMPWDSFVPGGPDTSGNVAAGATVIAVLDFLSYIIVLNTVVPISLYVSVEIIRFAHSWWINWDKKMYHKSSDTPARSRTTTLNEELGQIEYIFSDKTGTLTQNIMQFNKASINGRAYGDPVDSHGNAIDITEKTPKVDLSFNPYAEKNYEFYDRRLIELIQSGDTLADEFFRLLALCHTVMPEEKDGLLEYQAQSPDEGALVSAARNFGFVFKSRTPQSITIEVHGEQMTYELLCILDFNNVRKRMSVIVRKDGEIFLYCKGADTTVYERLDPLKCSEMMELTTAHLNDFAQDGLRTLCLAYKKIPPNVYEEWKKKHHVASTALTDRDDKLDEVYEEIEKDMELIGATAIEDKLQDGVPDCIANLALAGIKIWVLTGDKQETAINIGYSCKLLTDEMEEIYVVDGETYEDVEDQLQKAYDEMRNISAGNRQETPNAQQGSPDVQFSNDGGYPAAQKLPDEAVGGFALVINGHSLVHALQPQMELLLLNTGCMCKAVICCRVTPLQKALVVDLIKRHKKTITLAIGDGANDVSMIKTAHIGVGISGQEGMQAVLASDFSIAQFRYLERLLLVHGRWSYLRMCKFLRYFFYKNFAFTLCHFWYAFFCGFSAQTLFDPYFISFYNMFYTSLPVLGMGILDQTLYDEVFVSLYNVCYTSLPILALGIFDQDVNDDYSLRYPKLYTPGHLNLLFNKKVFAQSVAEGIVSSLVLFFIPYGAFYDALRPDGSDLAGHQSFGVMVASTLIVAVTFRCALDTTYWTGMNQLVIWGSILFYFAFTFVFYADIFGYKYQGTARNTMSTANFWFTLVLTVVVLLVPVVAERFYYIDTRPTLTDKVRLKQKISKSKSKSGELILRRASTMRRSTRSLNRSGYAFAHQEGFGNLITSGTNMRQGGKNNMAAAANNPRSNGNARKQNGGGGGGSNPNLNGNSNHNNSKVEDRHSAMEKIRDHEDSSERKDPVQQATQDNPGFIPGEVESTEL